MECRCPSSAQDRAFPCRPYVTHETTWPPSFLFSRATLFSCGTRSFEDGMRRREFIAFVSGAAAAWPLAVRGQQPSLPLIGVLSSGPARLREDQSGGLR